MVSMKATVLLIAAFLAVVFAKDTYIVTVPKTIRPGSSASISLTVLKAGVKKVRLSALLIDDKNITISDANKVLQNGLQTPHTLKLQIPKSVRISSDYKIRVKADEGLTFEKTAINVRVSSKASSIFIQTDKPIYKPGDLVQFRVFGTKPDLKVLSDPIDIVIQDPKRNRLKQFIGVKPAFGVFSGTFKLSSLTTFGQWQIKVEQGNEKNSKSFTVEKYVLPKFDVNVVLPPFQLKTDKYFKATINAMYTFGKPVEGDVLLTIRQRYRRNNDIIKRFKIKGKATIKLLMSEIGPRYVTNMEVIAKVTESVSGVDASDTGSVTIYETPEKLAFSSTMANVFKPGLKYTIHLRANQHDESPLKPPLGKVNVTVDYSVPQEEPNTQTPSVKGSGHQELPFSQIIQPPSPPRQTKTLWTKQVQIPKSGIITLDAIFPAEAETGSIQANFRKSSAYYGVSRAESPSNSFIQVLIKNNTVAKSGQMLPLEVRTTETIPTCNYKIFSKGHLISHGKLRLGKTKGPAIRITHQMAPQAKLLVYYTRKENGEIVADAISLNVKGIFKNEVSLKFSNKTVKPADKVELGITADPGSLVNILAVDQSVLLMKTGNDITTDDVLSEMQMYGSPGFSPRIGKWDSWWPRPIGGRDAFSIFNQAGLYVLTDATLFQYRPPTVRRNEEAIALDSAARSKTMAFASMGGARGGGGLSSPGRTRKEFPETWLWLNRITSDDGKATILTTVPDTITKWITSAFAVNPESGLGVAPKTAELTTFQRFFMRFELPYSAIRGEVIIVQITVFNYHKNDQQVTVTLKENGNYSFVDSNGEPFSPAGGQWNKTVPVKADSVGSVSFPIMPTQLGKLLLHATARSTKDADAVERELLIEAEGIQQSYNDPLIVDLREQNTFSHNFNLSFPTNLVQDSEFIKLHVIGDVFGPTLSGLENLLQMSYGSGEQNMVGFTPNVYASAYLKTTNRLTEELKERINSLLETGYQRQLTFLLNDGSFSAFGTNDHIGSTWLTSYVIKTFAQSLKVMPDLVDTKIITAALKWLLKQQSPSGEFTEPGIVIQKEMQGGSTSSKRSLTAFVLIALHVVKSNDQVVSEIKDKVNTAIKQATVFVSNGAPASIDNLYELAISFYALSLVNDPKKERLLVALESKAVVQDGMKFWTLPELEADKVEPWRSWRPPKTKARAVDVETTSYVLLGYNLRGDTKNGIQVLKWLGIQRNPQGGFISSQDTVVALQALSELGEMIYVPDFNISVTSKSDTGSGRTFNLDNTNALVLQTEDLNRSENEVGITATGHGIALVETAVYFNVKEELREPAFKMTSSVLNDSIQGFRLKVCFSWLKKGASTMGYLEISIPTGMDADLGSLDVSSAHGLFKKAEKAYRQINLFFSKITSREMCVEVNVNRISPVSRHKSVPIKLSEYQEPSNEAIIFYQSKALANASIVDVCGPENCYEVKK